MMKCQYLAISPLVLADNNLRNSNFKHSSSRNYINHIASLLYSLFPPFLLMKVHAFHLLLIFFSFICPLCACLCCLVAIHITSGRGLKGGWSISISWEGTVTWEMNMKQFLSLSHTSSSQACRVTVSRGAVHCSICQYGYPSIMVTLQVHALTGKLCK